MLEASSAPACTLPKVPLPAAPITGVPESYEAAQLVLSSWRRPCSLLNWAIASWPSAVLWPLEYFACTTPSRDTSMLDRMPVG